MTLKVLHVYKTFFPDTFGGVEQYIKSVSKATRQHGIIHKVLCTTSDTHKETLMVDDIEVLRYPYTINLASCPMSVNLLFNFKEEIATADIIHYHYPWPFADLLALIGSKKKHVITYHSDIVRQRFLKQLCYPLDQYMLFKMDRIIATSPQYTELSTNLQRFADKTSVIPITISKDSYPSPIPNTCKHIKKNFGKFVLFVGQLRYYKGLDKLVRAMKGLSYHLVIIGDGTERDKLQRACIKHSLSNVHFLGNLSEQDKVNYLKTCSSLVLPSNSKAEAFGISLLEGAMFSKPLISCDIKTGTQHINKHLETGLVVPYTTHDLRSAIIKILSQTKLAQKMGANALKRFNTTFNSDIVGKQLAECYKALIKETA